MTAVAIVAHRLAGTNGPLAAAWRRLGIDARVLAPRVALEVVRPGDVAVCRLDVLPTLDGIEPGLPVIDELAARRVRIVNTPAALLGAHDKLETARRLAAAGIRRPRTAHVEWVDDPVELPFPVVLKPRFGSWGRDVFRCSTEQELRSRLRSLADRPWFTRHGALVQELVEPSHHDLRVVVAGSQVVGCAARTAAAGEWRSNVTLGGTIATATLDGEAQELALGAARALDSDLVGIDLIGTEGGGYTVIEANGAVDFDERYALAGRSIFDDVAAALELRDARVAAG